MIRKIGNKERTNGMRYCTFCKQLGFGRIAAVYRDWRINLACEKHKNKLDSRDDGCLTEADYQTWMGL